MKRVLKANLEIPEKYMLLWVHPGIWKLSISQCGGQHHWWWIIAYWYYLFIFLKFYCTLHVLKVLDRFFLQITLLTRLGNVLNTVGMNDYLCAGEILGYGVVFVSKKYHKHFYAPEIGGHIVFVLSVILLFCNSVILSSSLKL